MMRLKQTQRMKKKMCPHPPGPSHKLQKLYFWLTMKKARLLENFVKRFFFRDLLEVSSIFCTIFRNAPNALQ